MSFKRRQLGEILVAHRLLTRVEVEDALAEQRRNPRPLGQILIERGCITQRQLIQVLAAQRGIGVWEAGDGGEDTALAERIGLEVCRRHSVIPLQRTGDLLALAMADSEDIEAIDMVRNVTSMRIQPVLASREDISATLAKLESRVGTEGRRQFGTEAKRLVASMSLASARETRTELTEEETKPVESLVNGLIADAIRRGATDVHIEPEADTVVVRFRIDGVLRHVAELPRELAPMVTARVKIMASLDIVEYRMPQDGNASVSLADKPVDLRVSVVPGMYGSRLVLRLLDHRRGFRTMEELGLSDENLALFRVAIERPYGIFLVSGPTGSGKTTTLYSALNYLVDGSRCILTAENPIEYSLDGVGQSQTNPKVGVTFATLLRAFLRQDPDVIMVGEIRDEETAATALRAAMTGHLVFSTVHANDAASVVARLLDLGLDPGLLSSCLVGAMAQRLVRQLCPQCRRPTAEGASESSGSIELGWEAPGCEACEHTGLLGRIAVHELLPVDPDVASLVAQRAPVDRLREASRLIGMQTMAEDGLRKVRAGLTTLAELRRHVWLGGHPEAVQACSDRIAAA